jgi:hypothetical protein
VAAARHELHGKDLASWCTLDLACHADVLLDVARGVALDQIQFPAAA